MVRHAFDEGQRVGLAEGLFGELAEPVGGGGDAVVVVRGEWRKSFRSDEINCVEVRQDLAAVREMISGLAR
ncbi:protein of unknown function [Actinokineospora iranica]|uniref:Uncharacterized protein n=2 Tax=Actinokineospora iranica TaxID=1271860 RepID=A0A1G6SSG4_9PSEU|nr:protein of unknown function [Actinokineospora iranica]